MHAPQFPAKHAGKHSISASVARYLFTIFYVALRRVSFSLAKKMTTNPAGEGMPAAPLSLMS
jgi:hypothetical protein